ncbi:HEAT repeat domain-containing protein [Microbacterium dextranolyticum]|uniref:HEAT repeat domain-containing protein n=1 Tax=Microbacterium dextranolyticum TaxID=36806 RepID=A0A9W6HPD9_9MICO|nr:HEAT repeat domain-containing protein [Microbacterium dextranolyticum]MBM7462721.1 hypothetical protein [Microbacterium dextranolyticum]GLJ96174.1 hypothetical protein GCM10017591_22370 [Microbacterium dextranolyticum]
MASGSPWTAQLAVREPSAWPAFLTENSGLPGPRANLALLHDVALAAGPAEIEALLHDGGEYPVMCAAAALALRAQDPLDAAHARSLATDGRWRVREGVATGLQLLGNSDLGALIETVGVWVDDPNPLVMRAAIAAICEPRLLRTPNGAAAALDCCRRATAHLVGIPASVRRSDDVRTLRQALGYCWSIAVAADPAAGLSMFQALDTTDPDVAWIVRENQRKKRLAALL